MKSNMRHSGTQSGFTLVEILVYLAILMMTVVASITLMLSLRELLAAQRAEHLMLATAHSALDRIVYEIRQSDELDVVESTIETASSVLVLNQGSTEIDIRLEGGGLVLRRNDVVVGTITPDDVTVTDFVVYHHDDSAAAEMVRVMITASASIADSTVTETLYGGAVLRGSYE